MNQAVIRLEDGFIVVYPNFPDTLLKQLKYWHKSLEWDPVKRGRVVSGQYIELYQITNQIDSNTKQPIKQLITLPGLAYKVKQFLINDGWSVTIEDNRTPLPKPNLDAAIAGLHQYQIECAVKAILSGGGIVACPTGWGKTHIMAAICSAFEPEGLKVRGTPIIAVAAPDRDIVVKNYYDLKRLLPNRNVGLIMAGKTEISDDIQVITLNSLHRLNPYDVGIIIVDEVHTAASETRADALLSFSKAARWGVSATPLGRFDGRDLVTEGIFGPIVYRRTYQEGVQDGILVPIKVYWIRCPEPQIGIDAYNRYKTRESKYKHGVILNYPRNKLIGQLFYRIKKDKQTLCIVQYIEHMSKIIDMCPNTVQIVHAETSQENISEYKNIYPISAKERRKIYDKIFKKEITHVLSTYVYKQGVNFPNLEVVINAGGGGSEITHKQIPGRESRKTESKDCAYLIDFWHDWDYFVNQNGRSVVGPIHADDRARERSYRSLGFEQYFLSSIDELPIV